MFDGIGKTPFAENKIALCRALPRRPAREVEGLGSLT